MIYNLSINQKAIIDNKWDIDINHAIVFDAMQRIFTKFPNMTRIADKDGEWTWIDYKLLLSQLPIIKYKTDWLRRIIVDLSKCDLIEINPNNQTLGRTFFRFGKNGYLMDAEALLPPQTPPTKQSDPLRPNSQTPMTEQSDKYTKENNINDDNISLKEKGEKENIDEVEISSTLPVIDLEKPTLKSSAFIYEKKGGWAALDLRVPFDWPQEKVDMFNEYLTFRHEVKKKIYKGQFAINKIIRDMSEHELNEIRDALDKTIGSEWDSLYIKKLNNGNSKGQSTYVQRSTGKRAGFITDAELDNLKQQLSQDSELDY